MDVDVDKMFSILKVPNEKIRDKLISDVKKRVTSIKHIIKKDLSFNQVCEAMKMGFEKEFKVNLVKGNLTDEEINLAKKYDREIFLSKQWNYKK